MDGHASSSAPSSLSSSISGVVQNIRDRYDCLPQLTWQTIITAIVLQCIVTRMLSGLRSWHNGTSDKKSSPVTMVPYWVPWIGHGLSLLWDHVNCVREARRYTQKPVFGLKMGSVKYLVVTSASMTRSTLSSPSASSTAVTGYLLQKVFGDRGEARKLKPTDARALSDAAIMQEPYRTKALAAEVRMIEREMPSLVTFSRSLVDQTLWEQSSQVKVRENDGGVDSCEAELFALIKGFVGYISAYTFMGRDFAESYAAINDDFWTFSDQFITFAIGAPYWIPMPGVSAGYPARERVLRTFTELHDAFAAWDGDGDSGLDLREFGDMPENVKERFRLSRKLGLSPRASAAGQLHQFWAMIRNTPGIVFWNLLRIHVDRNLLEEIRKEIAPYAKAFRQDTGFLIQEPPKLSIDQEGLINSCPLLKATYYETLRFDTTDVSFRHLASDLELTETNKGASPDKTNTKETYKLQKGEHIAIPHGLYQEDAKIFENPNHYNPRRFIYTDFETGKKGVYNHGMTLFDDDSMFGHKGHAFAEQEILVLIAAVLTLWDMEPGSSILDINPAGSKKEWRYPGYKSSIGALVPRRDVRVKLRMRI